MTKFSRCAWSIVLALAAGPSAAFAQSFACYPVQRGDTASRVAKRITGDASNKYQPWFTLVDLSARPVPKSQYNRVRSGWRACIFAAAVATRAREESRVAANQVVIPAAPAVSELPTESSPTTDDVSRPSVMALRTKLSLPSVDLASLGVAPAHLWLGAAIFVPAVGFLILGGYARRRDADRVFMWQFAHLFVSEFERPLLDPAEGSALKARLRASPYRSRMEISLAPGNGRRYPNLSDHRKNVEYDVARVLSTLADESFVCGRLRMRDGWVVIPFRFNARLKQRGVRCISSL
jgi:hypothetical protein